MIPLKRALLLLFIYLKASLRRIRYDFARELVVGICTLVLLALFFYIFNDFINIKVAELSDLLRQRLATGFSYVILGLVSIGCGSILRSHRLSSVELARVAVRLGDLITTRHIYSVLKTFLILGLGFGIAWYLIHSYFIQDLQLTEFAIVQTLSLIITLMICFWPQTLESEKDKSYQYHFKLLTEGRSTKRNTLLRWRLGQLLLRNRTSRLCLAGTLLFHLMIAVSAWVALPFFIAALLSFFAGLLVTAALSVQLEADMKHAWLEKSFGISHSDITNTYQILGGILGGTNGLIALLFYCFAASSLPNIETLKLVMLAAVCPLLMPGLMFQIDARRPFIVIITSFLVGLFLGTAIIAHWLGILLLPIVIYYSNQYQSNQFYQYQ